MELKDVIEKHGVDGYSANRRMLFHWKEKEPLWKELRIYETKISELDSSKIIKLYEFYFEMGSHGSAEIFFNNANHHGLDAYIDTTWHTKNDIHMPPGGLRHIFIDIPENYRGEYEVILSNLSKPESDLLKESYEYYFFEKNILPVLRLQFEEARKID